MSSPNAFVFDHTLHILITDNALTNGASVPHLTAMVEYLCTANRQLVAIEAGLMDRLFRRMFQMDEKERTLSVQCVEKMCLSSTGRDELINHITIQNVLAVIQDEWPVVRAAVVQLLFRLSLFTDLHSALTAGGVIQTLIKCLSNDECDFQNALIPKTATAALANMAHVTQVESLINEKTIKRLFELMKMWGNDEHSLISVLKLCCNYSIAVECKDPLIVADVSTFASDIVTIVTTQPPAPLQSGSPSASPAPSISPGPSPSFDESSMTASDSRTDLTDDVLSKSHSVTSLTSIPVPRIRNIETLRYACQLLVSLSISEDGKRAVIRHNGIVLALSKLAADGMICLPSAEGMPTRFEYITSPNPIGQFTGGEVDTGIRQNCCHTLRHVAENSDGLKVVGRALVECGEVMLFILGPQSTATVLSSLLTSTDENLLLHVLFVMDVLLSTPDGYVALYECLYSTQMLLDLVCNTNLSERVVAAAVQQLCSFIAQSTDAHRIVVERCNDSMLAHKACFAHPDLALLLNEEPRMSMLELEFEAELLQRAQSVQ